MKRFLLAVLVSLFPVSASAQMQSGEIYTIAIPTMDPMRPGEMLPYAPPAEPDIPIVEYLKRPDHTTLQSRVEALIQGIKVDIKPEYDHYGYEIRRYMAHVGNPAIYKDRERLKDEISNAKKARIVFRYWQIELVKEIDGIEKAIAEDKDTSSQLRETFKFNKGIVSAFLMECNVWLDKNEDMLNYLLPLEGTFTFNEGKFIFANPKDRYGFSARYEAAQQAREYINGYDAFAAMVY